MESKFKVGDRVRVVENVRNPYNMWIDKGDKGVVVEGKPIDGFVCVKVDGCTQMEYICIEREQLEIDTAYDPKTAFLSDLASVLRKYNAEIIGGGFDGYGDYLQVRLGNELPFDVGEDNQYDGVVLTADNIMYYDKE